jgi:hypothetical protein
LDSFLTVEEVTLVPRQRPALDATIRRLIQLLPSKEQFLLVPSLLTHRRAARRRVGVEILNRHPSFAPQDMKLVLLQAYKQRTDPELLTPLSRISSDIQDIVPTLLEALGSLHDANGVNRVLVERARVFERLVISDLVLAARLGQQYPAAFIYGVGRARCKEAEPYIVNALEAARQEYDRASQEYERVMKVRPNGPARLSYEEFSLPRETLRQVEERITLGIWALGRLQARNILREWANANGVADFGLGGETTVGGYTATSA